jgi:hypothetical protein
LSSRVTRDEIERASVGGLALTPVKKENGARLGTPAALTVLTQAMGRGTIESIRR